MTTLGNQALTKATLSIKEFCAIVGIGRTTLYEEIKRGRVRVLKLGTRTLIPAVEVDRLIAQLGE